jgi:hypothetical protein
MSEPIVILMVFLVCLQFKHFLVDFVLQTRYQLINKGHYGHLGGIIHAGLHGIGTLLVLIFFAPLEIAVLLSVADMIIHYHIDYFKVKINNAFECTPKDSEFWTLLGLDQFLHQLTYIAIVFVVIML